jgi:multidrug resistance efflux pump
MKKKKFILFALVVAAIFAAAFYLSKKKDAPIEEIKGSPTSVSVQSSDNSRSIIEKKSYPAIVVGDQEISIIAQTSGVITHAPPEIGSAVRTGTLLARIDDRGSLKIGDMGFRSSEIQQSEISAEKAKESYSLSKDVYREAKKSDVSTKLDEEIAETQKEIAKLEYEAAKINLQSSIDKRILTSPIKGFIIDKNVSAGDFVSAGQKIATVSKTSDIKIRF